MTLTYLFIFVFIIGLLFYVKKNSTQYESLTNNNSSSSSSNSSRCPNMLIQKGSQFYLYNSNLAQVSGVNPVEFDNLEDYTEFLSWQRSQNIVCPVLYLQETYDAQGNRVYKSRPSVSEPQGGLPPSISPYNLASPHPLVISTPSTTTTLPSSSSLSNTSTPYNTSNSSNPYSISSTSTPTSSSTSTPTSSSTSLETSKSTISPNPMDPNWGGSEYTQNLIDKGVYKNNSVSVYVN